MTIPNDTTGPNIASLAALFADPARAQMVYALMDGRALTAGELALASGVAPPTASSHLAKLIDGGVLTVTKQGRHRYYRIAGPDAAQLIETLSVMATGEPGRAIRTGPRDEHMRRARVCYDHLAGFRGVQLLDGLMQSGALAGDQGNVTLTAQGEALFQDMGIDIPSLRRKRRPLCRSCIDWSERRPHLAGSLGAAVLARFLDEGWIRRKSGTRALIFSPEGLRRFDGLLRP
jgi:DNA-binding transcriptional ArsR family regulator